MSITTGRSRAACVSLFLLAATVRLAWFFYEGRPDAWAQAATVTSDEREYDGLARSVLSGNGYRQTEPYQGQRKLEMGHPTAFRTPGLPGVLALLHAVGIESFEATRMALLFLGCLIPPLVFLLALSLFGVPWLAGVAGVAYAFEPTSVKLSGVLFGEEIATVMLVGALVMTVLAQRRRSYALAIAAGLLLGWAILTRGFLLFIPLALAAWLLLRRQKPLALVFLLGAGLLPSAWLVRNLSTMGIFSLSTETPEVLWLGHNRWARGSWPGNWREQRLELLKKYPAFDQLGELGQAMVFTREAREEIVGNPRRVLWLLPRKAAIFFNPRTWLGTDWVLAVMLLAFPVGLHGLWKRRESRHLLVLLALPIAADLLVNLMAYSDVRHRHPIDPLVLVIGAYGMHQLAARYAERRRRTREAATADRAAPPTMLKNGST